MKIKKAVIFLIIAHIVGIFFLKRLFTSKPAVKDAPFSREAGSRIDLGLAGKKPAIEALTVRAASLTREDLDLVFSYVGNIKAKNEAKVYSKVNGKLDSYVLNEGDKVKKDETVALVERDETGLKYELARVSSPIDGVVGKVFLDKGENILAQSTAVALVVDSAEAVVEIDIPEQDIPYISKGCPAKLKLDSYPGEIFSGKVSKVSEVLDIVSRALDIEIALANPENRLKSGMFARIDILAGKRQGALALPQDALSKEDGSYYVYVVQGDKAKKVKVEIGISNDKVEIVKGLEENQKVIVFGQQGLRDGAAVKVIE